MSWLNSLPLFTAGRQAWRAGYGAHALRGDILSGLTVGIIAIPLAMALAIAIGAPPQYGLYTVLIAAPLIALTGGSRFNISGPTAAFVVILLPIVQQHGLSGLLICTMLAGLMLIALGLIRAGRLIQFVPYPVTLGFTAGIGVVIAGLQLKDVFGLTVTASATHFPEQMLNLVAAFPTAHAADALVAAATLGTLILWPKLVPRVPGHLAALAVGTSLAMGLESFGWGVATLGERFSYTIDGVTHAGIPPYLPEFALPWNLPGAEGLSFALIRELLAPAMAIAMLGAIESLLCAVVADGMKNTKHDPNGELIGQGIGNLIAPLFGGITATAAIARTAASVRAGAFSPLAAIIHAGVVLVAVLVLAPLFSYLPMAALAALLLMVAWNMAEVPHVVHTLRIAPRSDVLVLLVCLVLTVVFDMVLAVGAGLLLAAGLFIRQMSRLTATEPLPSAQLNELPPQVAAYAIRGPLFFGAAEKALEALRRFTPNVKVVIVDMRAVPLLDMTAIAALETVLRDYRQNGVALIFSGTRSKVRLQLRRAGIHQHQQQLAYVATLEQARAKANRWLEETEVTSL